MSTRLASLLVPLVLSLASCSSSAGPVACEDACSNQDEKSFCDVDGVYPASEQANQCIEPPSADACNRVEACSSLSKPFCTDESMGVCAECRDAQDCGSGEVCNESNECEVFRCSAGTAGDAACAAVDATQPYCGDSGFCVGCLDSGDCSMSTTGVCDQTDFQCRACVTDPDCDSKVCAEDTGICADESDVLYVEKDAAGTSCTLASPCGSIMTAVGLVTATKKTIVIGPGNYDELVTLSGIAVTILGEEGANIQPNLAADESAVTVSGNADVAFENVDIALQDGGSANSVALLCEVGGGTPAVSYARGEISGSGGLGIEVTSCALTLTRSTITGNAGGGILVDGGDYSVVNNFIVGNVGAGVVSGFRAEATLTKSESLEFNTFVGNQRGGATGFATVCEVSNLVAANNIFVLPAASVASLNVGCGHAYSLFDTADTAAPTTADNNLGADALFVNASAGNYHLVTGSPGIDAADPAATLTTDIDGDQRPLGNRRDMGADEAE